MIFVGDIALPYVDAINLKLPKTFDNKKWIGNLEGALVRDWTPFKDQMLVVNDVDALKRLTSKNDFVFTLANNHILDNEDISSTEKLLKESNIQFLGAGINLNEASQPFVLKKEKVVLLNFGWEVIQCEIANNKKQGVNPLEELHIKDRVLRVQKEYPNYEIILLFHWNYELEKYPMPYHRRIAHDLIDMGVSAIIGHHPHRVQGYEMYKEKPIIYSLGNWLFPQNVFKNKSLSYPDFCNLQLAFEFDKEKRNHLCHFFEYDRSSQRVSYQNTISLSESEIMSELSPFSGMSHQKYNKWFRKHRYHKKIIPVYKSYESQIGLIMKNKFNRFRDKMISILRN